MFFVSLYLAHEMQEESDIAKWEILPWALGPDWKKRVSMFFRYMFNRLQLDIRVELQASLASLFLDFNPHFTYLL
jgi:hypothetical protein